MADQSLDDIIKADRSDRPRRGASANRGGSRGGNRGGRRDNNNNGGGSGGFQSSRNARAGAAPYARPSRADGDWGHDLYGSAAVAAPQMVVRAAPAALFTSGKLLISNLDFGVSDDDVKELFSKFGETTKASVNYDRSGRSLGTAYVVYRSRDAAINAMREYNGVSLDGKPMQIELVSNEAALAPAAPTVVYAAAPVAQESYRRLDSAPRAPRAGGNNNRGGQQQPRQQQQERSGGQRGRGGARGGRGGREARKPVSAEDLDKDLDMYSAEAGATTA